MDTWTDTRVDGHTDGRTDTRQLSVLSTACWMMCMTGGLQFAFVCFNPAEQPGSELQEGELLLFPKRRQWGRLLFPVGRGERAARVGGSGGGTAERSETCIPPLIKHPLDRGHPL